MVLSRVEGGLPLRHLRGVQADGSNLGRERLPVLEVLRQHSAVDHLLCCVVLCRVDERKTKERRQSGGRADGRAAVAHALIFRLLYCCIWLLI